MKTNLLLVTLLGLIFNFSLEAQNIRLDQIASGFNAPVHLTHAGDGSGKLYVVEQAGIIKVIEEDGSVNVFFDIRDRVRYSGEMGLLGLAFDPDFESNGYFYVNYNRQSGQINYTRISRFSTNNGLGDPSSETLILEFTQPFTNHNGGTIFFGQDGYLYISSGDGGGAGDPLNNAQTLTNLLGKILRIDVHNGTPYAIPESNPFATATDNTSKEIYAYGLRNPWKISQDIVTGTIWIADVGQSAIEEVDTLISGANYGWKIMEGGQCYSPSSGCNRTGLTMPVFTYPRNLNCSITGGYVYRGSSIPELSGSYIFGDYCSGRIWALSPEDAYSTSREILDTPFQIASFGQDQSGEVYVLDFNNGIVYMINQLITSTDKSSHSILISVFPNPANEYTEIKHEGKEEITITVSGADGRSVNEYKLNGNNLKLNLENYLPGIYFIKVTTEKGTEVRKLIVE